MSLMQPNTPERTHRFQIFGVVFDHANNQVLIDCVDPDDVTSRVTLSRRYELDARADAETIEKVASVLSDLNDLACAADDLLADT